VAQEIHVSFAGMSQLVGACRQQRSYVEAVADLVTGSCGNVGAFTGVMGLFAEAYRDAQRTVARQLGVAVQAADRLGDNIADTRADFRRVEGRVVDDLDGVRAQVRCVVAPGLAGAPADPTMPGPVKSINAALHLPARSAVLAGTLPERTPPLPDAGGRGLPMDGIDVATQALDVLANGQAVTRAQDDLAAYEQFEAEHLDRTRRPRAGSSR